MSLGTVISAGTVLLTCFTGILFLFGWAYTFEYYAVFGIDLHALDLPAYDFLIASIFELPRTIDVVLIFSALVMAIAGFAVFVIVLRERFWFRALRGKLPNPLKRGSNARDLSNPTEAPKWIAYVMSIAASVTWCMVLVILVIVFGDDAGQLGKKNAEVLFRNPNVKTTLGFKRRVSLS